MLAVTSMIIDCGDVDEAVGQNRDADGFHRYHSWVQSPPPQSSLSLSPTNARRGTSTKIRPQLARSTQRVRPLPHENREWRAGALVTRDVTPGAFLVQGLVHQLRVWCLVLLTQIVSSTLRGIK